jgi:hypothetical protein
MIRAISENIMHLLGISLLFDITKITWNKTKVHIQSPEVLRGDWSDTTDAERFKKSKGYTTTEC